MSDMSRLEQRVATLEAALKGKRAADADEGDEKEASLKADIVAMERKLAGADEADKEDEKKAAEADKEDDGKKASEVDPDGIEEQITQDRFTEVEKITHGTELTTGPSMGAVAPTRSEYVARLKSASVRLDKVAEYLEKHGRRELAFRIDKIADAIDEKINEEDK